MAYYVDGKYLESVRGVWPIADLDYVLDVYNSDHNTKLEWNKSLTVFEHWTHDGITRSKPLVGVVKL